MLEICNTISIMSAGKTGIGQRIRETRQKMKLSQVAFAALVGSSKSSISGYEVEDVPVPAPILPNIITQCKISADYLLFGIAPDVPKDEKEREILKIYREVQEIAGHQSIKTTMKYLHVIPSKQSEIKKLDYARYRS